MLVAWVLLHHDHHHDDVVVLALVMVCGALCLLGLRPPELAIITMCVLGSAQEPHVRAHKAVSSVSFVIAMRKHAMCTESWGFQHTLLGLRDTPAWNWWRLGSQTCMRSGALAVLDQQLVTLGVL